MAERIQKYEQQRNPPQFQRGSLSGHAAAVRATGQQASALGAAGQAVGMRARVFDNLQDTVFQVGSDYAQYRGRTKPLPNIRADDGTLLPRDITYSVSIEQQEYNQRIATAYADQAMLDYRKESDEARRKYQFDAGGYSEHMDAYRQQLLGSLPEQVRDAASVRMRDLGDQNASGIAVNTFRQRQRANDTALSTEIKHQLGDMAQLHLGDEPFLIEDEPNPEFVTRMNEVQHRYTEGSTALFDAENSQYEQAEAMKVQFFSWLIRKHGKRFRDYEDTTQRHAAFLALRQDILEDRLPVIGYLDYRSSQNVEPVVFSDLTPEQQRLVREELNATQQREEQEATFRSKVDHLQFMNQVVEKNTREVRQWRFSVPSQYQPLVSQVSGEFGVPQEILASFMAVESGGNPNAVSSKGARGLLQVIPETWARVTEKYFAGQAMDPNSPVDQMRVGAAYMAHIMRLNDEARPNMTDRARLRMLAVGYFAGEGVSTKALNDPNFNPDMPLFTYPMRQDDGANTVPQYVAKIEKSFQVNHGGAVGMMNDMIAQAGERYGYDPVQYNEILGHIQTAMRNANNLHNFNQQLVESPTPLTMQDARSMAAAVWNRNYVQGGDVPPQEFFNRVTATLSPESPENVMLRNAHFERLQSNIGRGNTSSQKGLEQALSSNPTMTGQVSLARTTQLNASLPATDYHAAGGDPNPVAGLDRMLGDMPPARAAQMLAQRYRMGGKSLGHILPHEANQLFTQHLEDMVNGNAPPERSAAIGNLMRMLFEPNAQMTGASADSTQAVRAKQMAYNTWLRLHKGESMPPSKMRKLSELLMAYGEGVTTDSGAAEQVRDILLDRVPEDAFENLGDDDKAAFIETWQDTAEDGFTKWSVGLAEAIPHLDQVSNYVKPMIMKRAAEMLPRYTNKNRHHAVQDAAEQLQAEGRFGLSEWTYDPSVTGKTTVKWQWLPGARFFGLTGESNNFRRGESALVTNPVELTIPKKAIIEPAVFAAIDPKSTITMPDGREIPLAEATPYGAINSFLAANGVEARAEQELFDGRMKLKTVGWEATATGSMAPIWQIMRLSQIPGTDDHEYRYAGQVKMNDLVDAWTMVGDDEMAGFAGITAAEREAASMLGVGFDRALSTIGGLITDDMPTEQYRGWVPDPTDPAGGRYVGGIEYAAVKAKNFLAPPFELASYLGKSVNAAAMNTYQVFGNWLKRAE